MRRNNERCPVTAAVFVPLSRLAVKTVADLFQSADIAIQGESHQLIG
jgi:hypothetical protein